MYVKFRYRVDGADPPHMDGVRFKGLTLADGSVHEVAPELAGHAQSAFPGRIEILSGEPKPWRQITAFAKKAAKLAAERAAEFRVDPAAALEGLQPIPPAVLKALRAPKEADAVKALEEGVADAYLGETAVWAQLGGRAEIAKAAARRAEAIRPKA